MVSRTGNRFLQWVHDCLICLLPQGSDQTLTASTPRFDRQKQVGSNYGKQVGEPWRFWPYITLSWRFAAVTLCTAEANTYTSTLMNFRESYREIRLCPQWQLKRISSLALEMLSLIGRGYTVALRRRNLQRFIYQHDSQCLDVSQPQIVHTDHISRSRPK